MSAGAIHGREGMQVMHCITYSADCAPFCPIIPGAAFGITFATSSVQMAYGKEAQSRRLIFTHGCAISLRKRPRKLNRAKEMDQNPSSWVMGKKSCRASEADGQRIKGVARSDAGLPAQASNEAEAKKLMASFCNQTPHATAENQADVTSRPSQKSGGSQQRTRACDTAGASLRLAASRPSHTRFSRSHSPLVTNRPCGLPARCRPRGGGRSDSASAGELVVRTRAC